MVQWSATTTSIHAHMRSERPSFETSVVLWSSVVLSSTVVGNLKGGLHVFKRGTAYF